MKGKKYTAEFRVKSVKEYLSQKDMTMAQYARKNGIAESTFNDWVIKYKELAEGFFNVTDQITTIASGGTKEQNVIRKYPIAETAPDPATLQEGLVRVTYNGAVIEFHDSLLDRVMETIRQW